MACVNISIDSHFIVCQWVSGFLELNYQMDDPCSPVLKGFEEEWFEVISMFNN